MDISDKKTVLDDSASIYQRREEKTDRAKWKELKGFGAKWDHFKSYYLLKTIIIAAAVALGIYVVYAMLRPVKERLLYVAILDGVVTNDGTEALYDAYTELMEMDEETQECLMDNTMMISNQADANSQQKFTTHSFAGEIDVIIAKESVIQGIANNYFYPLDMMLSEELCKEVEDRFCYAPDLDEGGLPIEGTEKAYGIYVTDLVEVHPYCREEVVLTLAGNTKHKENAETFIRYLLSLEKNTTEE